jgi:hypothetical protein
MEFVKKSMTKWTVSLIMLVVGILCIVAAAASGDASADAYTGISMTIGISLIVISSISILLALCGSILTKIPFAIAAIGSASTLALGILFVVDTTLGGTLIWLLLNYVPYLMIVAGAILAVDAILMIVFGITSKNTKAAFFAAIPELVISAITIVLGALMVGNDPVISKDAQLIIFGIIIILYSILLCLSTFTTMPAKKASITAEVKEVNNEEPTEEKEAE